MFGSYFLTFAALCLAAVSQNANAFTVSSPQLMSETRTAGCSTRTRLWAEEGDEGADSASSETGGADILSSPAFLSRKIDVLKSDIEAADGEIAELTKAVEEGKAEWGEQLDKLRAEVCQTRGPCYCSEIIFSIAEQILKKAIEFEITEIVIDIARMMRTVYSSINKNYKKSK